MRAYSESSEEAVRARGLLKDWSGEGFLSEAQYKQMEQETVCDLRRTNIFLRLVLFFFTLIIVGAAVGLFFVIFLSHAGGQATGVFLLMVAGITYAAAELAVSRARLYRYGIEEALAVCSVGFLCVGVGATFFSDHVFTSSNGVEALIPISGAILSLWIWNRFGLAYAFLAAMALVPWMTGYWTSSHAAQHGIIAVIYTTGLCAVAAARPGHRFTYRDGEYSIAEALLWLGIYLAINLQLSSVDLLQHWWRGSPAAGEFPSSFYWATWALTWCLPPVALARGVWTKDRFVIAVGAITAILTLATNKPYLGWERHTWDPMLLGVLLVGVAILVRRWLARGPGGIRKGFTAQRLSGKDKTWMNVGTTAFGLASNPIAPSQHTGGSDVQFGGGDSGGGGASSDF